jgi:hypothetical protein
MKGMVAFGRLANKKSIRFLDLVVQLLFNMHFLIRLCRAASGIVEGEGMPSLQLS